MIKAKILIFQNIVIIQSSGSETRKNENENVYLGQVQNDYLYASFAMIHIIVIFCRPCFKSCSFPALLTSSSHVGARTINTVQHISKRRPGTSQRGILRALHRSRFGARSDSQDGHWETAVGL